MKTYLQRSKTVLGLTLRKGIVAGLIAGALATADLWGQTPASPANDDVQRLAWIAGCWQQRNGDRLVEEQWMLPRGGMMLGMSRTTRGDRAVEFEQIRIYLRNGKAVYAAAPSGQAPAEFEARAMTDSEVVFENLAHDFPQRILYRRQGGDSLVARIEGMRDGKLRGVDFPYTRVACP